MYRIKNNREHGEHGERESKTIYKTRPFMFSILFPSKIKRGTKIKNLKNISKTFQKPIDILIFMCYNCVTVKKGGQHNEKR